MQLTDNKISRSEFRQRLYRRRYLVPNAVTVGNLFCGFLTIVYASMGKFQPAAVAIGVAILLDGLDGRVARRLNATSKFGVEFDSFSDLVSFGVAPAFLLYFWCFRETADELGVLFSFFFVVCAAARLARFNVAESNSLGFQGLPTPGAAALVAALVNFAPQPQSGPFTVGFGATIACSLGILMVSRLPFFSVKKLKVKDFYAPASTLVGVFIALTWYNSRVTFVVLAVAYVCSGPATWMSQLFKKKEPVEEKQPVSQSQSGTH